MNSKTNLKHFLYTKLKSNYNRLWFLSLHDDKINKDFGNKLRTYKLFKSRTLFIYEKWWSKNFTLKITNK